MHNNFKARLAKGEVLFSTFQKTPSMMVSEVLAKTELDAVCLDTEHSPFDRRDIDACLLALRSENMPSLVRVPSAAPEHILNALDCGATGIIVPHVDSPEKADAIVRAAHYGVGGRGYAGSTRSAAYTGRTINENKEHGKSVTTVIAQIEDLAGVDHIEDIVAVDGIDCFFIGLADLASALGCATLDDQKVIELAEHVCRIATQAKRRIGIFPPNAASIPYWQKLGVSFFLFNSEHTFIKQGAEQMLNNAHA